MAKTVNNIFSFFAYAALVVTVLLLLFLGIELSTTQNVVETAAQIGAHVSAISNGNVTQIQQAVFSAFQQDGLPTTYNGQNLLTVTSNLATAANSPTISVTVQYTMPTFITNLGDLVGDPNSMPATFSLQATESYTNDTFFGG